MAILTRGTTMRSMFLLLAVLQLCYARRLGVGGVSDSYSSSSRSSSSSKGSKGNMFRRTNRPIEAPFPTEAPNDGFFTDAPGLDPTTVQPTALLGTSTSPSASSLTLEPSEPAPSPTPPLVVPSIDEIIASDTDLRTLFGALNISDLIGVLPTDKFTTVFAPVDVAFDDVDQELLGKLLTSPGWTLHLQNFVLFHATEGSEARVLSGDLVDGTMLTMRNGEVVSVGTVDTSITLSSTLTQGAKVIEADIVATNGNVLKTDAVLMPFFMGTDVAGLRDTPQGADFSIMYELFELHGLADSTTGIDVTVLAPTDAAFLALGNETLEALKSDTFLATSILSNHILDSVQPSVLLFGQDEPVTLKSLGGLDLMFTMSADGIPSVNGVTLSSTDGLVNNGIVHGLGAIFFSAEDTTPTTSPRVDPVPSAPVATMTNVPVAGPVAGEPTTPPEAALTNSPSPVVPTATPTLLTVGTTTTRTIQYGIGVPDGADGADEAAVAEELETAMSELVSSLNSGEGGFSGEFTEPPMLSEADCSDFDTDIPDSDSCWDVTHVVTFTGVDDETVGREVVALESAVESGGLQEALEATGSTLSLLDSPAFPTFAPTSSPAITSTRPASGMTTTRTLFYDIRTPGGAEDADETVIAEELNRAMDELASSLNAGDNVFTGEFNEPMLSETDCEEFILDVTSNNETCWNVTQQVTFVGSNETTVAEEFAALESAVEGGGFQEALEDTGSTVSFIDRPVREAIQYSIRVPDGAGDTDEIAVAEELQAAMRDLGQVLNNSEEMGFSGLFTEPPTLSSADCSDFFPIVPDSDSCWNATQQVTFVGSDEATVAANVAALESAITDGGLQEVLEDTGSTLSIINHPLLEVIQYDIIVPDGRVNGTNESAVAAELQAAMNELAEVLNDSGELGFSGQFIESPTLSATNCSDFFPAVADSDSCWNVTHEVIFVGIDEPTVASEIAALKSAIEEGGLQMALADTGSTLFYIDRPIREILQYDIKLPDGAEDMNESAVAEELQSAVIELASSLESVGQFIEPPVLSTIDCAGLVPQGTAGDICWNVKQGAIFIAADDATVAREVATLESAIADGELQGVLEDSGSELTLLARAAAIQFDIIVSDGEKGINETGVAEELQVALSELAQGLNDTGLTGFSGQFSEPPTLRALDCADFVPKASTSDTCWNVIQEATFIGTDDDTVARETAALEVAIEDGELQKVLDDSGSVLTVAARAALIQYEIRLKDGKISETNETAIAGELRAAITELAMGLGGDSSERGFSGRFLDFPTLAETDCADFFAVTPPNDTCWNVTHEATFVGAGDDTIVREVAALDSAIEDGGLQEVLDDSDSAITLIDGTTTATTSQSGSGGLTRPQIAGVTLACIAGFVALAYAAAYWLVFVFALYLLRKAVVAVKFEDKSTIVDETWRDYSRRYKQRLETQLNASFDDTFSNVHGDTRSSGQQVERVAFRLDCDNNLENHDAFLRYIDEQYGASSLAAAHVNVSWTRSETMCILLNLKKAQVEEVFRSYISPRNMTFDGESTKIRVLGMAPVIQADNPKLHRAIEIAEGRSDDDVTLYKHDDEIEIFAPNTTGGGKRLGAIPYYRKIEQFMFCTCEPVNSVGMTMFKVDEKLVLLRTNRISDLREYRGRGFTEVEVDGAVVLSESGFIPLMGPSTTGV